MKAQIQREYGLRRPSIAGIIIIGASVFAWSTLVAQDNLPEKSEEPVQKVTKKEAEDEFFEYYNWVEVSAGGIIVKGDNDQFLSRHGLKRDVFGGIGDIHFDIPVGEFGLLQIEGHALVDNNDYLIKLDLSEPDVGFLRAGFREYRIWYDGSGGYFPPNNGWISIFDEEHATDRGEAWFEGGLRKPDWPNLTFKFTHKYRDGGKDSTSWAETNGTGGLGLRSIVPSFRLFDEERNIFEGDITHTIGKHNLGVGLRYDAQEFNNSLNIRRAPTESSDRIFIDRQVAETDIFNVHGSSVTKINEKTYYTMSASYTTLDRNISGGRVVGSGYDAVFDPLFQRQNRDHDIVDLKGDADLDQYVVNFNLKLTPVKGLSAIASARLEKLDYGASSDYIETNFSSSSGFSEEEFAISSNRDRNDYSGSFNLRYTGTPDWVFSASGFWSTGDIMQTEREIEVESGDVGIERATDTDRTVQKYAAGVKWYPRRDLNFAAQYYHKIRENDYTHPVDSTGNTGGNRFPAFITLQDFTTDDFNIRCTWKPHIGLTLVSRYDYQSSTIDSRSEGLAEMESSDMTSHIFSQAITWSPFSHIYVQGSINYVTDEVGTGANKLTGEDVAGLVLQTQNDYWNASIMTGIAVNEKTDVQAQYYYYRADNYVDNSTVSLPYGAGAEEQSINLTLTRRVNEKLRYLIRYGFFNNRSDTSGGNNDYDAHLLYTSMQYRF